MSIGISVIKAKKQGGWLTPADILVFKIVFGEPRNFRLLLYSTSVRFGMVILCKLHKMCAYSYMLHVHSIRNNYAQFIDIPCNTVDMVE